MAMTHTSVGLCRPAVLKAGLAVIAMCIAGYILGPPLYWHFMEGLAAVSRSSSSCPSCVCDCSSQPILSIPLGNYVYPFRSKPMIRYFLLFLFNFFCYFFFLDFFLFITRSDWIYYHFPWIQS